MSIEARLTRIEAAAVNARFCKCPGRVRVLWPDDERHANKQAPGALICERCGGHRQTIRVSYGDADAVN